MAEDESKLPLWEGEEGTSVVATELEGLCDMEQMDDSMSVEECVKEEQLKRSRKREETFPLLSVVVDHLEPFVLHIAFAMVFSGLARAVEMLYPIYIAVSIDVLRGRPPSWVLLIVGSATETTHIVAFLTIVIVALYGVHSTLNWIYQAVFATLGEGLKHSIRMELFDKLQIREVSLSQQLSHSRKRFMGLLVKDCEQLEKLLLKGLGQVSQLLASIGVGVAFMVFANWKLAIVALGPCFFILFLSLLYWYQVEKLTLATEKPRETLECRLLNTLRRGLVPMHSHNMNISEYNRIAVASRSLQETRKKMLSYRGRFASISDALMLVGMAGVTAVGSFWLLTDAIESEELSSTWFTFFC
jgi:ATP-binding cassette, subfamily B, bacterial